MDKNQASVFDKLTGDKDSGHWSDRTGVDPYGRYSAQVYKLLSEHAREHWRNIDFTAEYRAVESPESVARFWNTWHDPAVLFQSEHHLAHSGFLFRIQDNGGATYDRITVVLCDGDALLCSSGSTRVWIDRVDVQRMQDAAEAGTAVDLAFGDLSASLRRGILDSVNGSWRDCMKALIAREKHACAPTREKAKENDGTTESAGIGIYSAGAGYCVRLDTRDAADDRGPFMTAREALAATLPEDYSLSGPEYHSPLDVGSMRPTPGVAEDVAALDARVHGEEK